MDFFKNTKKEKENNNIQNDETTKVKEEAKEDKKNETKENVTNKTSADMLNSLINDEEVDGDIVIKSSFNNDVKPTNTSSFETVKEQNPNDEKINLYEVTSVNDKKEEEVADDVKEEEVKLEPKNKPDKKPLDERKKTRYKYQIINSQGEKVKGYFDAYSDSEVRAYLENEGYKITSIGVSKDIVLGSGKLSYSELAFVLTQLSTYLKAGISLVDSIRILEKQSVRPEKRRIYSNITYELVKGESFSTALEQQGNIFPTFLVNMVKTAEMTGDLPSTLDDMADYYTTTDRTRKAAISAMTYPTIVFIFAIAVITFIMVYVLPTFKGIFMQSNMEMPYLTKVIMGISDTLVKNGLYIVGILALVLVIYTILFKNVKPFRKAMQTIMMKTPIFGKIIIYKEVTMFTKTFASLLSHNVFITDSMQILSQVTSNEVYAEIIGDSLSYLAKGAKISDSFKGKWAFPVVAYEMLVTGENTGRLAVMMDYVAKYYDDLHANYVKRLNTLIEPLMIVFLALIVGIVVLSVIIPMFGMYEQFL